MQNLHARRRALILSSEIRNQRRLSSAFPTQHICTCVESTVLSLKHVQLFSFINPRKLQAKKTILQTTTNDFEARTWSEMTPRWFSRNYKRNNTFSFHIIRVWRESKIEITNNYKRFWRKSCEHVDFSSICEKLRTKKMNCQTTTNDFEAQARSKRLHLDFWETRTEK